MTSTIFVSDIHLTHKQPVTLQLFLDFLHSTALEAEALYILGDFFALWLGDDINCPILPKLQQAFAKLAVHTKCYFLPGNRDFLVGAKTLQQLQLSPLSDPTCITIYNQPIILTHGDRLCTNDTSYQYYRLLAQNRLSKKLFSALPSTWREKIASNLQRPINPTPTLTLAKYDATTKGYKLMWDQFPHAQILIHGHTHRPKIEKINILGAQKTILTLGEWLPEQGSFVRLTPTSLELETFKC